MYAAKIPVFQQRNEPLFDTPRSSIPKIVEPRGREVVIFSGKEIHGETYAAKIHVFSTTYHSLIPQGMGGLCESSIRTHAKTILIQFFCGGPNLKGGGSLHVGKSVGP